MRGMRILIGVMSAPGHFTPTVPVALELRKRGHEVIYMGDPGLASLIGKLDFPFVPVGPIMNWKNAVAEMYPEMARLEGWKQSKYMVEKIFLDLIPKLLGEAERKTLELKPDIVASDIITVLPMICEKHRIPWATLLLFLNFMPGREAVPPALGWPPPRSAPHRWAYQSLWGLMYFMARGWNRNLNEIRTGFGIPPQAMPIIDSFISPWLCLTFTSFDFEFPRSDLSPNIHLVGPSLWDGLEDGDGVVPQFEKRPLVYVTQGTSVSQFRLDFFKIAIEAMSELPVQGVMTTGFVFDRSHLGTIPENVAVHPFIPNSRLLPNVDLMVHHGGNSSTIGAVVAGVPQVVVPFNWDQPDNGRRVAERGLGVMIRRKRLTPAKLRGAIERVLGDDSFRARCREVAARMSVYNAPRTAADLLERLGRERRPILRET